MKAISYVCTSYRGKTSWTGAFFILSRVKINHFHCVLSLEFTKLSHTIFTSVHIMLNFYASKWRYCRHWKTWWNMFAYFCCRWIFRIIFTLFNYPFKICINNKWCFIRFLILMKFLYFSVFRMHNYVIKIFIFTYLFMRFKFVFCSKGMKAIQVKKSP